MKPNILIIGPSGTGKSSSIRNCDPLTTGILNSEQKALPFKGGNKFKMNIAIADMDAYWDLFPKMMAGVKTKLIVNESLTSLFEHIHREASKSFSGFDFWDVYAKQIGKVLHEAKNVNKYVAMIGIDGVIEGANGAEERYFQVQGSWKKKVEKEFVIVLYTACIIDSDGNPQYKFITNKQKGFETCSAKSPMGMLPLQMPNDLSLVIELAEKYYNGDDEVVEEKVKAAPKKEAPKK
jgi:hypothetical protein